MCSVKYPEQPVHRVTVQQVAVTFLHVVFDELHKQTTGMEAEILRAETPKHMK